MVALALKVLILTLFQLSAYSQRHAIDSEPAQDATDSEPAQDQSSAARTGSLGSALRGSGIVVTEQVDKDFLLAVEAALGTELVDRSQDRMEDIMKGLRPMFESLEKNEYDKLGPSAVRYALHRLFIARHGWQMKGLDPAGQRFSSSSPVEVLKGKASLDLQEMFEKRLADQGFGLQELAVFASVLETLISMETGGRLKELYQKLELPLDVRIDTEKVDEVLDLYMAAYITLRNYEDITERQLRAVTAAMNSIYTFWPQAQKYVHEIRAELLEGDEHSLEDVSDVLVKVGERFGKFQNAECHVMKKRLIGLEGGEKGCVPLSNFYKGTFSSASKGGEDWQFGESMEYLKVNGVIDASDPGQVTVMVANYIYSPSNCIASSKFYGVCCIDECESLFGHIERQVRGATASPDELAAIVAALPSDTVPANRTLSPAQSHRLFRIAAQHGGRVPIHGRLFMQWMHMVYPRECAYPHMANTTSPLGPEEWTAENKGKNSAATREEMASFVNAPATATRTTDQGQCGRWIDEEELFVGGAQTSRRLAIHELESEMSTWVATYGVFFVCLGALATVAIQTMRSATRTLCGGWKSHEPRLMMMV